MGAGVMEPARLVRHLIGRCHHAVFVEQRRKTAKGLIDGLGCGDEAEAAARALREPPARRASDDEGDGFIGRIEGRDVADRGAVVNEYVDDCVSDPRQRLTLAFDVGDGDHDEVQRGHQEEERRRL